jgi:serine/threonine protein kinase/formylglycine-generating enzyme required for sulfatase activity
MPSNRPPSPLDEDSAAEDPAPGDPGPEGVGARRPIAERLKELYGEDVDPGVSLGDEPMSEPGLHSKLFEHLRAEGPRGTRYRLLSEIGRGGMGAIIKVWDDELRRSLAMKVVLGKDDTPRGDTPDVDPRTLGRFLEEAQITGQLDHPGIVPVHELGLDATGRVYFTMRLVKGEDLRTVLEHVQSGHDGWSQVRALNVILRVCEAMAFAHSKEVIHRDLKPANIMVGRFGEVYVMDWGLARVVGHQDKHDLRLRAGESSARSVVKTERHDARDVASDSPLMTMDGDVVGTPSFMPPEQALGELEKLGAHSDVYSIGAMLYQLLTGLMPYVPEGARVSPHTILASVLQGPPPSIESLAPRTPPELVAICEKAMAREIEARYPTTAALAADLRAYIEGRVVAAYETGTWAETRKWVLRNQALAGSLATAVLAIVLGLVGFGIKAREAETQATRAEQLATAEKAAKEAAIEERLKATQLRDAAVARADALWTIQELAEFQRENSDWEFAYSLQRSAVERWLETARRLVNGRAADEVAGIGRRPGLADHQRLLAEIRAEALPARPEELDEGNTRVAWSFDDREKRWWSEQLTTLESDLIELRGWLEIAEHCATSREAQALWSEARTAIQAHPKYDGLELGPQLFLLPLGPDAESGLWEFAHLLTGKAAVRGADGKLALTGETGLVFVLLPGGRLPVEDGSEPGPLNEVNLVPFLLSKYEMTRGQWTRISVGWTGRYIVEGTPLHPADGVSWDDCQTHLGRLPGWVGLPSEAQWEYGCRAGTTTPWWTGTDEALLRGAAQIQFDPSASRGAPLPVGTLRANPFGLHDVHGNVTEWCQDLLALHPSLKEKDLPPFVSEQVGFARVSRGGSYMNTASMTGSGLSFGFSQVSRRDGSGLRPCHGVTR